jgi:phospholipase/carboxylesterase
MKDLESATETSAGFRPGAGILEDRWPRLETVEITTGPDPVAAVIWLHGLGADGHDFEPAVPQLLWPGAPPLRWVFPHAPLRAVTLNGGMQMRAWYDILGIDSDRGHDAAGIEQSVSQVASLVQREHRRGIHPHRIAVAGFSQGGAIAIQLALRYSQRLAGLIALSTYMVHSERLRGQAHPINRDLPVFMAHGSMDGVVPLLMGVAAADALRAWGYALEWHDYPMAHAVCPEEIVHIRAWLGKHLA